MTQRFELTAIERLRRFLSSHDKSVEIELLTPDASTREYFRLRGKDSSAIACVYPESFNPLEQSYLDVTALFQACGLPVALVYDVGSQFGVIVLEDLVTPFCAMS